MIHRLVPLTATIALAFGLPALAQTASPAKPAATKPAAKPAAKPEEKKTGG